MLNQFLMDLWDTPACVYCSVLLLVWEVLSGRPLVHQSEVALPAKLVYMSRLMFCQLTYAGLICQSHRRFHTTSPRFQFQLPFQSLCETYGLSVKICIFVIKYLRWWKS